MAALRCRKCTQKTIEGAESLDLLSEGMVLATTLCKAQGGDGTHDWRDMEPSSAMGTLSDLFTSASTGTNKGNLNTLFMRLLPPAILMSVDMSTMSYLTSNFASQFLAIVGNGDTVGAESLYKKCSARVKTPTRADMISKINGLELDGVDPASKFQIGFVTENDDLLPKLLKPVRDEDAALRMRHVASLNLDHPNIMKHAVHSASSGVIVVMEFCPATLSMYPRPFPAEAGLGRTTAIDVVITQILDGLKYLHERGVGHHDVKPANLGVTQCGKVVLIDLDSVEELGKLSWETTVSFVPRDMPGRKRDSFVVSEEHDYNMLAASVLSLFEELPLSYTRAELRRLFAKHFQSPVSSRLMTILESLAGVQSVKSDSTGKESFLPKLA
eukprot:gene9917-11633_t